MKLLWTMRRSRVWAEDHWFLLGYDEEGRELASASIRIIPDQSIWDFTISSQPSRIGVNVENRKRMKISAVSFPDVKEVAEVGIREWERQFFEILHDPGRRRR